MANFPSLFTQAQLEIAVGGASQLLQLIDRNGTGDLSSASCQGVIAEIQRAATGEVLSILQTTFDPSDPNVVGADFVIQSALPIAAFWAWQKGSGGIAVPDEVKNERREAQSAVREARDGMRALATDTDPERNLAGPTVKVNWPGAVCRRNFRSF